MESQNLKEFKENFAKIYHKDVAPQLKYIDNERLVVKKKAFQYAAITVAIGLVVLLLSVIFNNRDYLMIIGLLTVIFGFGIHYSMAKNFERDLKKQIMPLLMKAFGNFTWSMSDSIDTNEIKASKIFTKFTRRSTDDNFYGTYRDMPIDISETELTYTTRDSNGNRQTRTEFRGVLISIGVCKNFIGHTIVRTREFMFNKKVYEEVKLEDPEFQKEYFVDSNDQVEARFLLTPAFMERFKNISTAFGTSEAQCSFKEGKILIALSCQGDLFKLGDLDTPVTDTAAYMEFLTEIISIFKMIDHLKITEKTGL